MATNREHPEVEEEGHPEMERGGIQSCLLRELLIGASTAERVFAAMVPKLCSLPRACFPGFIYGPSCFNYCSPGL